MLAFLPSLVLAADATPPSTPGAPTEGSSSSDLDYDSDGKYTVYWNASVDKESGIAAYELQEKAGPAGAWKTLTSAKASRRFAVRGRAHAARYFYQARAKNGAGLWGGWSPASDGILVDKTAPEAATVADDGAWTGSTSAMHAAWAAGSDPESGIARYEYLVRQDSTTGTVLVNYTSVGLNLEVTRTGLNLVHGKRYFIGVRAKNQAGLYSALRYSDGIVVDKNAPLIGAAQPADGSAYTEGENIGVSASAADADGDGLQCQFLLDGAVRQAWGAAYSWNWNTAGSAREHQVTIQVRDAHGRQTDRVLKLFGYRRPPETP